MNIKEKLNLDGYEFREKLNLGNVCDNIYKVCKNDFEKAQALFIQSCNYCKVSMDYLS